MVRLPFALPVPGGTRRRFVTLGRACGRRRPKRRRWPHRPAGAGPRRRALVVAAVLSTLAFGPGAGDATEKALGPGAASPSPAAKTPLFGETLHEDALVREVLARNPTLHAMRAAWEAAAERPSLEAALDDPEFSWTFAPATIGGRDVGFADKVELSQRIPWPGKRSARGEAARHEAGAAVGELEASRRRLGARSREAFYEWWYVHRALTIHEKNVRLLAELRDVAEVRYAASLASKQDALQAEVEARQLEHRGVVLRRMRAVALGRLNALLDRSPTDPLPPPDALSVPEPAPPREALEAQALERRPVLEAGRRRIRAREAAVRLAELDFLPDFTVMGAYDRFWEMDELRPMIGFGIEVPIQLERRRAALGEARARLREAESLLAEERAAVRFEVSRAYDELLEHQHVVELYRGSILPAADESLAAARSGYETGTTDLRTVIEAERTRLGAELTYERGIAEAWKARARLDQAAGTLLPREETP